MTRVLEIMDDALKLPRTDRGYLAQKIIESLDQKSEISEAEKELLQRRSRELRDGTVKGLSLEGLKTKVEELLND